MSLRLWYNLMSKNNYSIGRLLRFSSALGFTRHELHDLVSASIKWGQWNIFNSFENSMN